MPHLRSATRPRRSARLVSIAAAAAVTTGLLATGAAPGLAAQASGGAPVKSMANKKLGKTVLTNSKGLTLYSLSVEKNGKFICTESDCLALWHPLLVPAGTTPSGPVALGTVTRPEGTVQVTYRGLPLYTFRGDHKSGQANGNGFKDVGTWKAAIAPKKK